MSEEYKHIDDLFRDKFKDFELDPPEHVWSNIKTQIQDSGTGGSGGKFPNGGIYTITIIIILSGVLAWYLLSSSGNRGNKIPENNITHSESKDYISSTRTLAINQNLEKESNPDHSNINIGAKPVNKKKQKTRFDISEPAEVTIGKTNLTVQETIPLNAFIDEDHQSTSNDIEYIGDLEELNMITPGGDKELLALNSESQSEGDISNENTLMDARTIGESSVSKSEKNIESGAGLKTVPELRSDYGHKANWAFGLFFTPEMIFYPDHNNFDNRSYALDVNAIYKFSGYMLQSGIGVSWTSDEGNCEIEYNEYLGSYEDVYNVTFDTVGNELIPVYHTEPVKVYDSIDRVSIMPAKNHYTYLQIPLLFGYGNENRRFGWFVKGGPSLSIMVHEDIASNNMSETEDKILQIENEIPSRIHTNWQFVFSGGVSYRLSNHLSFTAEPVFRYYLNSTYEKTNLNMKNPYSLGLRFGFLVDL
jgi:hypothetical protein